MTYKHILQRVLREPAVEEHGNEEMPKGWKKDLKEKREIIRIRQRRSMMNDLTTA